ncbi:hypothetical protein F511_08427 [Dorcoceras hygrometricum]|uniref:Uncharacterized protein n=1 Tax=Dorcoceras hygrometricum TaxID=472368 RepID=A0A2Z7CW99_9LAMI|nr:hypothetical protein F511_08427 [Dorcoceras hygrometricum]
MSHQLRSWYKTAFILRQKSLATGLSCLESNFATLYNATANDVALNYQNDIASSPANAPQILVTAEFITAPFEEKSYIVGITMSPSVFSVEGVGTSSFDLVGTIAFWFSERDSATAPMEVRVVALDFSSETLHLDTAFGRLLEAGYHGYSAGHGVDQTGGAPGGG